MTTPISIPEGARMRHDIFRASSPWLQSLESRFEHWFRLEHGANIFPLLHVVGYYVILGLLIWPGLIDSAWPRATLWVLMVVASYSLSIGIIHLHAHRRLFTHDGANRVLEFFLSFPALNSYAMMRYVHVHLHHRYEDGAGDPTSTVNYRRGGRMILYWVSYSPHCIWLTSRALFARDAKPVWRRMRTRFAVDTLGCVAIAEIWAYFDVNGMLWLWLVPMIIVWVNIGFFAWLTHAPAYSGRLNGSFNTTNRWMNFFIHNQGYHVVHHYHPAIHWTAIPEHLDLMLGVNDQLIVPYWVFLTNSWRVATTRTLRDEPFARRWKERYINQREARQLRTPLLPYFSWI